MSCQILSADFYQESTQSGDHYHDCHEIIFITGGAAKFQACNTCYTAKQGDLVIFSRFEQHAVSSNTPDYQRYVLQIDHKIPNGSKDSIKLFSILLNRPKRFQNVLNCRLCAAEIQYICQRLIQEFHADSPYRDIMLNLLIQELLVIICRQFPEIAAVFNQNSFETVQQIQQQIEANFEKHFSLRQLAQEYGLSISHLSHRFKQITGTSVMEYLQSCRMAAAKGYLAETSMSIGQIIDACGFSDASNFSRTFRKYMGSSPSQFRKAYRS